MEKLFKSYVDTEFLKDFLDQLTSIEIDDVTNKPDILRGLYKFLSNNTKLFFKYTSVSVQSLSYHEKYSFIKLLLNKIASGSKDVELIDHLSNKNPLSENSLEFGFVFKCHDSCGNNIGIPIITSKKISEEWVKFYKSSTQGIADKHSKLDKTTGWEGLVIPTHACNAIIFADTYFFGDKRNIESNFKPILAQILPQTDISIEFDFTVFAHLLYPSYNYQAKKHGDVDIQIVESIHKDISEILIKDFNLSNVNFSVIHMGQRDFHERLILTNSFAFNSGNAFSYFDNTGKSKLPSPTFLNIHPLPAENNNLTYAHTYSKALTELEQISKKSKLAIGSKKNRLFNQF